MRLDGVAVLVAVGLSVADTEYTLSRPCLKNGTCTEWNPLLGTSRAQQYGVRMPALAVAWMAASWLRKGDDKKSIGGMRHWYAFPMIYMSMPAAGLTASIRWPHHPSAYQRYWCGPESAS